MGWNSIFFLFKILLWDWHRTAVFLWTWHGTGGKILSCVLKHTTEIVDRESVRKLLKTIVLKCLNCLLRKMTVFSDLTRLQNLAYRFIVVGFFCLTLFFFLYLFYLRALSDVSFFKKKKKPVVCKRILQYISMDCI